MAKGTATAVNLRFGSDQKVIDDWIAVIDEAWRLGNEDSRFPTFASRNAFIREVLLRSHLIKKAQVSLGIEVGQTQGRGEYDRSDIPAERLGRKSNAQIEAEQKRIERKLKRAQARKAKAEAGK